MGTNQEQKDYAVVLHSSGPSGGYVVRTRYNGWIPAPYSTAEVKQIFKRESSAQHYADKLNGRS